MASATRATSRSSSSCSNGSRRVYPNPQSPPTDWLGLQLSERSIQRHRHRGVAADQVLPRDLDALATAFLGELEAVLVDGQHMRFSLDAQLALQNLVESGHVWLLSPSALSLAR